jgi:hypothetical protein
MLPAREHGEDDSAGSKPQGSSHPRTRLCETPAVPLPTHRLLSQDFRLEPRSLVIGKPHSPLLVRLKLGEYVGRALPPSIYPRVSIRCTRVEPRKVIAERAADRAPLSHEASSDVPLAIETTVGTSHSL